MIGRVLKAVLAVFICAVIFFTATYSSLNTADSNQAPPAIGNQEQTPAPVVPDNKPALPKDDDADAPITDSENGSQAENAPPPPSSDTDTEEGEEGESGDVQAPPESILPDEDGAVTEDNPSIPLPSLPDNGKEEDAYLDYIERFTSIAYGELGTKEKKYNNIKYNTWYYGRPVSATSSSSSTYAWCIAFISWCANNADIPTDFIPKMNSASRLCAFYKEAGLFETRKQHTPAAGDIIFFGKKNANHAGIVIAVTDTTVTVIEGNSSDKVSKLTYSLSNSSILGYASPDYAGI